MKVHRLSIWDSGILEITVWIWCELTSRWSENIISWILFLVSTSARNARIPPLKSNSNIVVVVVNMIPNSQFNLTVVLRETCKWNFKLIRFDTFPKTQRLIWLNNITVSNIFHIENIDIESCCYMIDVKIALINGCSILKDLRIARCCRIYCCEVLNFVVPYLSGPSPIKTFWNWDSDLVQWISWWVVNCNC